MKRLAVESLPGCTYYVMGLSQLAFRYSHGNTETRKHVNTLSATNYTNYHELIWMQYAIGAKTNKGTIKSPPGRGIKGVGILRNILKAYL